MTVARERAARKFERRSACRAVKLNAGIVRFLQTKPAKEGLDNVG